MSENLPRNAKLFRCCMLLLAVFLRFAAANLSATIGSGQSWNPPIRIGVQSKRNSRPTVLASIATRQYSPSSSRTASSLFSDDEEVALLGDDYDPQDLLDEEITYASSVTRNAVEQTRGFRNSYTFPSLRRETKDADYYDKSRVVPCAAVAVSSKAAPTFTFNLPYTKGSSPQQKSLNSRKDAASHKRSASAAAAAANPGRPLVFWENMVCGAISRSVAQTIMHPANTMKTILQQGDAPAISYLLTPKNLPTLMRGAGANFVLSVPHGAVNFAVLEMVRKELARVIKSSTFLSEREQKIGPALDFMSSAISTICCSVVSTPQMMITDNIMAGNYPNLPAAVKGLAAQGTGLSGFYARGWWPGLVGKIPSYALTWTFFQQLKLAQKRISGRDATNAENSIMGCIASGTTVCIMIPMDTIKTRLVTQASRAVASGTPYKGIFDCAIRVAREEGIKSFYRGLPPRLVSVVPMIGIQFGVYEFMKKVMQKRALADQQDKEANKRIMFKRLEEEEDFDPYSSLNILEEAAMEVAASPEHPYPAPHFSRLRMKKKGGKNKFRFGFSFGTKKGQAPVPAPSSP